MLTRSKNFAIKVQNRSQGRTQNEYVSLASFSVKKCRPPWKIFDFRYELKQS